MPDDQKTMELLLLTKADLAGAKAAEASLEAQISKAKALGKAYDGLQAKLDRVRGAITDYTQAEAGETAELNNLSAATKKYIESLKNTEKPREKFELSHRQIHMLSRNLVKDMPELGHVLAELSDPWLGLALAVSVVIGKMHEYQDEWQKMVGRETPDWEGDAKKLEAVRDAYDDAAVSASAFDRELERTQNKPQSGQEHYQQRIESINQWLAASKDALSQEHELETTAIQSAEEMGLITHQTALAAKLKADEDYLRKKTAAENQAAQEVVNEHIRELANTEGNYRVAKGEENTAYKKAAGTRAVEKSAEEKVGTDQANLDKALDERKKLQDELAEAQRTAQNGDSATFAAKIAKMAGFNVMTAEDALHYVEEKNEANDRAIAKFQQLVKKGQANLEPLKEAADAADEGLNEIRERMKAYAARIRELEMSIPVEQRKTNADNADRNRAEESANRNRAVKEIPRILSDGSLQDAEAAQASGKATDTQKETLKILTTALSAIHVTGQDAITLIASAHNNTVAQQTLIKDLQRAVKELSGQIKSTQNP